MEVNRSLSSHHIQVQKNVNSLSVKPNTEVEEVIPEIEKIDDLQKKIDGVNDFLKASGTHLKFQLHEDLKQYYVSIVDETTKEVIKEVPPKKILDMHYNMLKAIGFFIDQRI